MQKPEPLQADQALRDLFQVDNPQSALDRSPQPKTKRLENAVLGWALGFLGVLMLVVIVIAWSMVHYAP